MCIASFTSLTPAVINMNEAKNYMAQMHPVHLKITMSSTLFIKLGDYQKRVSLYWQAPQ
jgi:hypothetical protein